MNHKIYENYLAILNEELVTALGCTEPIAIAYAAATARNILGADPDSAEIECSGNIVKNAMGVVVPNAGGLKGIQASVIAGLIGGVAELELEVLSKVTSEDIAKIRTLVDSGYCKVKQIESDAQLNIIVHVAKNDDQVSVEIKHAHTNIYRIVKNGRVLFENTLDHGSYLGSMTDRSGLTVKDILEFAETVDLKDVKELIEKQIKYNMAIAEEGLKENYGVRIGKTLLGGMSNNVWTKVKAYTAAASEARMSGSIMPVVTNSGSGNQGITASVPIIVYARETKAGHEQLIRALVLSNLLTVHQKTKIGRLSAFCGAVSAACAAGAGITYLSGGGIDHICNTIVNTLANTPGIICDGAKPSCAAKIATSLDASTMAHLLSCQGTSYEAGSGIIKRDIEKTIAMVGSMAANGMGSTDHEILRIMLDQR